MNPTETPNVCDRCGNYETPVTYTDTGMAYLYLCEDCAEAHR